MSEIVIRKATEADFDAIWEIFHTIIKTPGQYVYTAEDTTREMGRERWLTPNSYVACIGGEVAGVYTLRANHMGYASHIGNGSYIVAPKFQGRGVGRAMGLHSIETGKALGFHAIQFNIVISTNIPAVNLWQSLGWKIIGVVPNGYHIPGKGYVDTFIMLRPL